MLVTIPNQTDCLNCGCERDFHGFKANVLRWSEIIPANGDSCWASIDNDHYCHCRGYKPPVRLNWPERPDWDHYFLKIAEAVASRATCNRLHCGVVVTDTDNAIIMTGYNGAPAGEPHCPVDESLDPLDHCLNALHAENNVVVQAAKNGIRLAYTNWYLWPTGPCIGCQKRFIIPTRASVVVFPKNDLLLPSWADTTQLVESGVNIVVLDR